MTSLVPPTTTHISSLVHDTFPERNPLISNNASNANNFSSSHRVLYLHNLNCFRPNYLLSVTNSSHYQLGYPRINYPGYFLYLILKTLYASALKTFYASAPMQAFSLLVSFASLLFDSFL